MRAAEQHRGDRGAYERYLRGMDASMRQKVAITAAHLLCQGRVADMGTGSGAGSHALAALYPALEVTGVDLSETMVALAEERFPGLDNLHFRQGDVAERCFPDGSLDAVFDSSVLHHVTSFNGYDYGAAARALAVQARALRVGGVLIVRDFLAPEPGEVWLDLPAHDGDATDDPGSCSTAALFERFAREFRPLAAEGERGFPYEVLSVDGAHPPVRAGWRRYRVERRHAVEFVLRKDYRADWETEVKEEYTYFTQADFERTLAELGLRMTASTPVRNPWIVRNRFEGRFELRAPDGEALDVPATNYVCVGERVPPRGGVRFREVVPARGPADAASGGRGPARLGFLALSAYRDRDTGRLRDLVRRPHLTVDVLPWFDLDGDPFVLARRSYPRPILTSAPHGTAPIDDARPVGYATEPLSVLQSDRPLGRTVEEALQERARLAPSRLRAFREGGRYFPSPGGIEEEVRAMHVAVEPVFVERDLGDASGFSTSGVLMAIEARQVLRAAQVGALPHARLEVNVYDLLRRIGRDAGPWIGEAIDLPDGPPPEPIDALPDLAARPARRRFEAAAPDERAGFLDLRSATFEELDARDEVLHARTLEYVVPRELSANTVATAPLRRCGDRVYLGVDDDDLPAAQGFTGNSQLLVAPAWRLPRHLRSIRAARAWVLERLAAEHGLTCGSVWELGGRYHPSPGVTPEVVHPLAVAVAAADPSPVGRRPLHWVPLDTVGDHLDLLTDGHLRTVALRAAHALGVAAWSDGGPSSSAAGGS